MIKRILVALSLSLALCSQAHANDGNMLLDCMNSEEPLMQVAGEAFITGAYSMAIDVGLLCPVDGVTHDQMVAVVIMFLIENPEARHLPAAMLTGAALVAHFPCVQPEEEPGKWTTEPKEESI